MFFLDSSCVAAETLKKIDSYGIYKLIGAEWVAIITISNRGNLFVDAYKDLNGLGKDIPAEFLSRFKGELAEGPGVSEFNFLGVHFLTLRFRSSDRYSCYNIYAKQKRPFAKKDIAWLMNYSRANLEITRLNNEVIQNQNYIHAVFDSTLSSILALNGSGNIIFSNKTAKNMFHLPGDEYSMNFPKLFSPEKQKEIMILIQKMTNSGQLKTASALKVYYEDKILNIIISALRDSKEVISGVVVIADDITKQTLTELELEQYKQFGLLGEISASLAHDIKNPLMSILGCARVATNSDCDTATKDHLMNIVKHEADRIDTVVRQMLCYNQPAISHDEPLNINVVLTECITMIKRRMRSRSIAITTDLDSGIPATRANFIHMQQIFLNVLLNSQQSIKETGTISVSSGYGEISRMIQVVISDSGSGINSEDLNMVFDPFYTTKSDGTGLGLFIVRRTLAYYDGTIDIESREGGGTTCIIRMPLRS